MNTLTPIKLLVNELRERMGVIVPRDILESVLEFENEQQAIAFKDGAMKYAPKLDVDIVKNIEFDAYCWVNDYRDDE